MEAGDSVPPASPTTAPTPAPARRWRSKLLLLLLVLLVLGAGLLLLLPHKPTAPQTGLLKIRVADGYFSPMRTPTLIAQNNTGSTLLLWEPCRIERKETGNITVASSSQRTLPLLGTNVVGPRVQFLRVQLTGTNHGPWRVLVPVARYEWVARLEKLLGKSTGSLAKQLRVVDFLLQHSRTWVASEWFEESDSPMNVAGGPAFSGVPGRPPAGFSAALSPRPPTFQTQRDDFPTFFFILRNFYARYHHWPKDMAEVKKFVADKANLQPEVPAEFLGERFAGAMFSTNAEGGLRIEYRHGSMSLGGTPK